MVDFFIELNPIYQALLACTFTFLVTALGAALVFLVKKVNQNLMDILLSISAGIMLSSSIFSLIIPALDSSDDIGCNASILLSIGIMVGALLIYFCDYLYNKKEKKLKKIKRNKKKNNVNNLLLSMTIHNFPEGMAIGVAFAGVYYGSISSITAAISLAIGIGIQNFPEGSAISFPLYKNGYSKFKSFVIGGLTAIVEPIGGVIGVLIALRLPILLLFLLSLAAGSMFYVIVTELVPEAMQNKNKERMALYLIIGFIIMMFLDISLG